MVGTVIGGILFVVLVALAINFVSVKVESMTRFGYGLGALAVLVALLVVTGTFRSAWESIPY